MRFRRNGIHLLAAVLALISAESMAGAATIPWDKQFEISLDGPWRFKLEQPSELTSRPPNWVSGHPNRTPAAFEPFYAADYKEDSNWHDLAVPSNWEMAGYSPATYNEPDNASAFYRKDFVVPASWAGRVVRVNFDGVQNAAEVWLNGEPVNVSEPSWGRVNYHESGWTAWQADLTRRVRFGQNNILALRVTKNTTSSNLDSGDYYHVKMVYAPIKVDRELDMTSRPGSAVLGIANRYSFTDLSDLNTKWTLLRNGSAIATGQTRLKLAPRSAGKVALVLPADALAKSPDALRIDFDDPRGWNVVTSQFALGKDTASPIKVTPLPPGLPLPELNLVAEVTGKSDTRWWVTERYRGRLVEVKTEPARPRSMALADMNAIEGDIVLDRDPSTVVGHARASFADGVFSYHIDWTGDPINIQELGWTFAMPASCDRFSWKREALWSYYPPTHIGRPTGKAEPDSANADLLKVDRADAFDFNSTKYNCDWASLTDAGGKGLRVQFDADQRHHVRAGFGKDGSYTLVVNKQCSPPWDMARGLVMDLYLKMQKGKSVEGRFAVGSTAPKTL